MGDIEKKRAAETNLLHNVLIGGFFLNDCCVAEIALKMKWWYISEGCNLHMTMSVWAGPAKKNFLGLSGFKISFLRKQHKEQQTKKLSAEHEVANHMNQFHK